MRAPRPAPTISRRGFLRALAASGAAALAPGAARPALGPGSRRPNVLLIMSDEHSANVLGCYGNPVVRTPHLDGLARRGVLFDSCYCNSPLCGPSRLSFTSGRYVSQVGAWDNRSWLPAPDYPTLPRALQAAGYESFLCGKMHYDRTRRYGFTEIGPSRNNWHKTGSGRRRAPDDLLPEEEPLRRLRDIRVGPDSKVMAHDRGVTHSARTFLAERSAGGRPFFLLVGYVAPHFPLIVPQPYWEAYRDRVAMPVIPEGHLTSQPRNYKHLRVRYDGHRMSDALVKRGREIYYGLTQWLDERIGELLAALRASAVADDTIVIYTSDHGESLGEHGLWWKKAMYEPATRVPAIVSWPRRWTGGQRRAGTCSLVDLARTVAGLAGAETPGAWSGDSLEPWLDDGEWPWKDFAVSEFYGGGVASGFAMLRSGNHKYVYHVAPDAEHPAERELYDLRRDPGEFDNLALRAGHDERLRHMHRALCDELGETPEETERRCLADFARGYGRGPAGHEARQR